MGGEKNFFSKSNVSKQQNVITYIQTQPWEEKELGPALNQEVRDLGMDVPIANHAPLRTASKHSRW